MFINTILNANLLYLIGLIVSLIIFTIIYVKRGFNLIDGFIITLLQVLFAFLFAALFASFEQGKFEFVGVSYYGTIFSLWFVPLVYSKIRHLDFIETIDIIAPVHMLMLGFMKIGCFIDGCCYGITINGYQVPIQIYEAVIAFILFFIMVAINKKIRGYTYPFILITYGFIRFFIEFFRFHYSFEHILGFLTRGQIWSILSIIIGLIIIISKIIIDKKFKNTYSNS